MNQQSKFKQTEIGIIPEGWEVRKIKEVGKVITGKTPSSKNPEYFGDGILFVTPTDFKNYNKNIFDAERRISSLGEQKHKNQILPTNSIIVTCIGSDMGKIAITKVKCLTNQQINSIIIEKDYDYNFIYYKLKSIYSHLKLLATSGSTMPIVNKSEFENISLSLPNNSEEQKSIAKILSDLDSKIELLQKQNKTLEAIAQALFKHWFVDFEFPNEEGKPYKSSGGEMIFNEELEKGIPKGWEVRKLEDCIQFIKGRKPKSVSDKCFKGYLQQILIDTFNGGKPNYANPEKMVIVETTEPIMVMDGASSGRMEIGYSGIVGSTLSKVIVTDPTITNPYLFYFLKRKEAEINQNTTGTSIPHTDKGRIKDYSFAIPDEDLLSKFDDLANQLLNKIMHNKKERKTLSKTRDTLLPKLMSGQIRVKVPETEVN